MDSIKIKVPTPEWCEIKPSDDILRKMSRDEYYNTMSFLRFVRRKVKEKMRLEDEAWIKRALK